MRIACGHCGSVHQSVDEVYICFLLESNDPILNEIIADEWENVMEVAG